jgi:probable rRNA maturation factor
MIDLTIDDDVPAALGIEEAWVLADAAEIQRAGSAALCAWSLRLVGDATIASLNATWRNKPEPTDVLSFPMLEPFAPLVDGEELGDVVISVATAARQAASVGHALRDEIRVLLAHGLAHLLGHDHHEPEEAAAMAACEATLLAPFGVSPDGLVVRAGVAG